MNAEQQFLRILPEIGSWIERTLASHSAAARAVGSLEFPRLAQFYSAEILASSKAIVVPQVPVPPLAAMGLSGLEDFERMRPDGITYMNTFFVRSPHAKNESLHFHELVHVVQWQYLGPERFLKAYARGHVRSGGYATNPLEVMAYKFESVFKRRSPPFDVEAYVKQELDTLIPSLLDTT